MLLEIPNAPTVKPPYIPDMESIPAAIWILILISTAIFAENFRTQGGKS